MKTKTQDHSLIKRLLVYTKPYKFWFLIVFLLMLVSTFADLSKPVLIGRAVDLFTQGYKTPYVITQDIEGTIEFDGEKLRHIRPTDEILVVHQMIQYKNVYYWIENMSLEDSQALEHMTPETYSKQLSTTKEGVSLEVNGNTYTGRILNQDELKVLRSLNMPTLAHLAGLFLLVLVISFGFLYLQVLILQYIGQKIILTLRHEIYDKLLNLPDRFYHHNPIGKLVTRVTNDTETLNEMYTSVLVNLLKQILFILGVMVMMVVTDFKTALWVFALIPLIIIGTLIYKYFSRIAYREIRNKLTQMNTFLSEHISGMKIIQIFTREDAKVNKMKHINKELYNASMKELISFMLFRPFIFFLSYVGVGLVLLVGGNSVLKGAMSVGALIIMVSYTKDFFGPIEQLAENFSVLQSALASAEKVFTILDEENEIEDGTYEIQEDFNGSIEFKNVWFAYEGEDWILKDVSFKIEAGQKVAFVGATGAGKTSILSLICRYYDIQKGEILIDGRDIKSYKIASLRSQVGQVLQDVFMFTGDIKSNIRLGYNSISQETIEKASKLVNAHEFIDKLPNKYDEKVLERGANLSTGQRQLISFARAVAYNPRIFILDEATANIDTETESLIQDALYKMMEGRTTLMVAHRLSTIQHADNIIVLHKGKVREMGTHQELLGNKGIYYNLYQLALQSQVMA
nr:ABC transporter ATP-binding protein [uncultured Niameybacter sp.]